MNKTIERLSNAWKALRPPDEAEAKALQPSDAEVKYLPSPSVGWGQGYGYSGATGLSGMPGWINPTAGFPGTKIDYVSEVGDLTTSSLVMAAVNFHGTTLPEAPIQVIKTDPQGNKTPVVDHPVQTLLEQPNPFYPGELLWKSFSLDWIVNGNVYWHKRRNALGKVIQIWPWPSFMVRALWPRTVQEKELFDSFLKEQGWSTDNSDFIAWYELSDGRQWYRVPKEDVVHFRCNIDPNNTRFAMSQLASILREIFTDNQRANLNAVLMKNMGIVPWVLAPTETGTNIEKEHREEIKEAAIRNTTGDNSGKPLVLAGPMKPFKLSLTPKEMLIDNASIIPETRLAAVTGIPAIVLNFWAGLLKGTYANYEAAKRQAYEAKIKPDQRLIAGTLRTQLLPDFKGEGDHVRFDLSHVQALQEDENQRSKRIEGQFTSGLIKRSEGRADLGKGPSDPANPQADEVFAVLHGTSIVQPGEDPLQAPNVTDTSGNVTTPQLVKSALLGNLVGTGIWNALTEEEQRRLLVNASPSKEVFFKYLADWAERHKELLGIKAIPPKEVQDEAVNWWEDVAPEGAKDLINATA